MKRLHVSLENDLHMASKLFCASLNLTMNEVMTAAITFYLKNQTDHEINPYLSEEINRLTS